MIWQSLQPLGSTIPREKQTDPIGGAPLWHRDRFERDHISTVNPPAPGTAQQQQAFLAKMSSNFPFPLFHFRCMQGGAGWRGERGRGFELCLFRRCCAGQRSAELRHQREGIRHSASALSSVGGGESASPLTSYLSVTPHDRLWSMKAASRSLSLSVCSRPPPDPQKNL